jgi:hypothetical protein
MYDYQDSRAAGRAQHVRAIGTASLPPKHRATLLRCWIRGPLSSITTWCRINVKGPFKSEVDMEGLEREPTPAKVDRHRDDVCDHARTPVEHNVHTQPAELLLLPLAARRGVQTATPGTSWCLERQHNNSALC